MELDAVDILLLGFGLGIVVGLCAADVYASLSSGDHLTTPPPTNPVEALSLHGRVQALERLAFSAPKPRTE